MSSSYRILCTLIVLLLLTLLPASVPSTAAQTTPPDDGLEAAWARARDIGAYTFVADIEQTLLPRATVDMIGQTDRRVDALLEGQVTLPDRAELTLQLEGAGLGGRPVTLVQEGSQTYLVHDGERVALENPVGVAAPTPDYLGYLAAAENVRRLDPPPAFEGQSSAGGAIDRYAFDISGPRFAQHVLDQMADQVAVPPGGRLAPSPLLQRMSGSGELWVGRNGLPLRQVVELSIPQVDEGHNAQVRIVADFHFEASSTAVIGRAPGAALSTLGPARQVRLSPSDAVCLLFCLALALVLLHHRRHWAYRAITIAVSVILLAMPLLQVLGALQFYERQARAASGDVLAEAMGVHMSDADTSQQSAAASSPLGDPTHQCGDGVPGEDSDGDGLQDVTEYCLGTDPFYFDSDRDLITDTLEATGFDFAGKHWPGDPFKLDANGDGLADTVEWPAPVGQAAEWDPDGDTIPNLWDWDNDGDQVPDALDLSPFSHTEYVDEFSFSSQNDGFEGYQYIELQFRPGQEDHLRYTTTPLDWPHDYQGQIRDYDDSPDDVRLIPVLDVLSNRAPNAFLAEKYGLAVLNNPDDEDFPYRLILPVFPVGDGGQIVAFSTKVAYESTDLGDIQWTQGKLVWIVQMDADRQVRGEIKTQTMPIQTYGEKMSLTGLQVTKSRDFHSAVIGTPDFPDDDRQLFNMLFGLSSIYLNTHTLSLPDIKARFEDPNTDPVQKWGVTADVAIDLPDTPYGHRDAGLVGTSLRIEQFLDDHYAGVTNPAVIMAFQEETGSYNLDDVGQTTPSADVSINLSAINVSTVRGLKRNTYQMGSIGWEELSLPETMQVVQDTYGDDLESMLTTLQTEYPDLTTTDLEAVLTLFYTSWTMGQSRVVAVDGSLIPLSGRTDADLYAQLALPGVQDLPAYMLQVSDLTQPGGGLSVGSDQGQNYAYLLAHEQEAEELGIYGGAFKFVLGTDAPFKETGNFIASAGKKAFRGFLAIKTVVQTTKWARSSIGSWTGKMNILKNGQAGSRVLGALGCAITVTVIWAQFAMSTDFSDPIALKTAIVYAVLATVFAVVMFVISLNPIGSIFVMIFALADLLVFIATLGEISIQQVMLEALTSWFYSAHMLTVPDDADFVNFETVKPAGGLVGGSRLKITEEYVGKIARETSEATGFFGYGITIEGSQEDLEDSYTYGWKRGEYTYWRGNYVGDFPTVEGATKISGGPCTISGGVKTCRNDTEIEFQLVPHRDLDLELQPHMYFRTYYRESTLGGEIGWRKESTLRLPEDQEDPYTYTQSIPPVNYVVDVLPRTLTNLWSWSAIRNPDDDGDGLLDDQESGTWEDMWDSDCDGLSDKFERDMKDTLGLAPTKFDKDLVASNLGEDLNDGFEYRIGTRPDVADTDGDGLLDHEEVYHHWVHRFAFFGTCLNSVYGTWSGGWRVDLPGTTAEIWVFSDPLAPDADGDGLNDASERENATSPFAYNAAPRLTLDAAPLSARTVDVSAVNVEPGDTVALTVTLSSVGPQPITATLELCLPDFLTDVQAGAMTGDRTPAARSALSCVHGRTWSFAQANTLQLWEQASTTIVATVAPTAVSRTGRATASLPYPVYDDAAPIVDSVTINVDVDDPRAGIAAPADGAIIGGGASTYIVGGWAEDDTTWVSHVNLDLPGAGTVTAVGQSAWAYTWTLPADGVYTLSAQAYDYVGRASASGAITATSTITVDNTAPTVTFPLADGSVLRKQEGVTITAVLSGTASDNLSGLSRVLVSLDERPWREVWTGDGASTSADWQLAWHFPNSASAQGEHTVAVKAYDLAGNQSAVEQRTLLVDVLPPTSDLTRRSDPADPLHVSVGTPVTFTGIANDVGNAPLPPHPVELVGTLDSLADATIWLGLSSIEENDGGVTVSWIGDFNGDRLADLVVGLPAADAGGSVTVIYGQAGGWPIPPDAQALAQSRTAFVGQAGAGIGGSVAAAGDVNGDGYDDLLIGDAVHNRVFLIYGRPTPLGHGITLDGARSGSWTLFTPPAGQTVGPWLGSAGDVNGDGLDDVLIGATGATGATYLLLGQAVPWGKTARLDTYAAAKIETGAAGAYLTGVGDRDGDHYDEFAVAEGGTVYVFDGRVSFAPQAGETLPLTDADHTYASATARPQVVALGDVDGDDRADFVYQSGSEPRLVYGDGSSHTFSGFTPAPSGFLAAAGDVDADGRADLLIGNADDDAYLILGSDVSAVAATLTGVESAANAPYAAGADLNSDGSSDLLLVPHETAAAGHGMDGAMGVPHVDAGALPVAAAAPRIASPQDLSAAATAAVYYVDDDYCAACVNDGYTWGTHAFDTIGAAISAASPGDTIVVNAGVYGSFVVNTSDLTISGVDPDAVFIDGASGSYAIRISNAVGVRLEGMTLRNARYGVHLQQAGVSGYAIPANVTHLDSLLIHDYADHAVYMDRASTARLTRCTLAGGDDHIQVYGPADSGVDVQWNDMPESPPLAADEGGGMFSAGDTLYGVQGGGSPVVKTYDHNLADWVDYATAPRGFGLGSAATVDASDRLWALRGDDFRGGFNGPVYAIERVSESEIYVGGDFTQAGDANLSYLARWDGSTWVAVGGGGTPPNGPVYALAVSGSHVYAGGPFGVRQWDGTTWNNIANLNAGAGGVYALLIDGTTVYAGGDFTHIGGRRFYNIAKWDGTTWDGAGCGSCSNPHQTVYGPDAPVYALATSGDRLYVGGDWEYVMDGSPSGMWDPNFTTIFKSTNDWSQVNGTLYGTAYALRVVGGYVFVGGDITSVTDAGGTSHSFQNLVIYETAGGGDLWLPDYPNLPTFIDPGPNGPVRAIDHVEDGSNKYVYIAGDFTTVDGVSADRVARLVWSEGSNSGAWSALGGGASGQVNALAAAWSPTYSVAVYTGGVFTQTGSTPTPRFALWDTVNTRWTGQVFYRYNGTAWASRRRFPATLGAGASIIGDGSGHLYALAGKGSRDFYRYTISTNTWDQMADVPGNVGAGGALVWADGALYAARGGGTPGFYRYTPGSNSWAARQSPADGISFGAGASLAWDGGDWLFAILGGNGSHFQRYHISTDEWFVLGDGSSATTGDDDVPQAVNAGGGLAYRGDVLYAVPGGGLGEMWWYPTDGLDPVKLTLDQVAFVAPETAANRTWLDLDSTVPPTDFFIEDLGNSAWVAGGSTGWVPTPSNTPISVTDARLLDPAHDVYRVGEGTVLNAGYHAYRPDATVSPAGGGGEFTSIQAAVDSGANYVLIQPGVYRQPFYLVSGVTVRGSGAGLTVIEPPAGHTAPALVSGEGVAGATLSHVTLAGDGAVDGLSVEGGAQAVTFARAIVRDADTGVYVHGPLTELSVANATIVGNRDGMVCADVAPVDVRNTIFAYNSGTGLTFDPAASPINHFYNAYWTNGADLDPASPSPAEIFLDPLFTDRAAHDYRPLAGSPVIGACRPADPAPPGTVGRVDLGYVEQGQAAVYADDDYCATCGNDGLTWGVDAFGTIQDALDKAQHLLLALGGALPADGFAVGVGPGVYTETVTVPSTVRLVGSGAEETTITAAGSGSPVTFDGVVQAQVTGFTLTGAGSNSAGVRVRGGANAIRISRNVLRDNTNGVRFDSQSSGLVTFNTIVDNANNGLVSRNSGTWVVVRSNIVVGNVYGLRTRFNGLIFNDYNLFYDNASGHHVDDGGTGLVMAAHEVIAPPGFVDAAADNYRLTPTSPALDAASPGAAAPVGGGVYADLGYRELLAAPVTLLLGQEDQSTASAASGVGAVEVGVVQVSDSSQPITATLPATWSAVTLDSPGQTASYWQTQFTPPGEGLYRLYSRTTDQAGNRESDRQVWFEGAFVADATAPVVTWLSPAPGAVVASPLELRAQVADYAADSFSVESVHFLVDGVTVDAAWAAEAWDPTSRQPRVFRAWTSLPTGSHTLVAVAQDRAGNVGQSTPVFITVNTQAGADTTPPALTIDAPTAGSCATATVAFAGTASDSSSGLASVEVSVDGGITWLPAAVSGADWRLDWDAPVERDFVHYPVRVRASDRAGNVTVDTQVVVVDNQYPAGLTPVIFSAPQGTHFDSPTTLTIDWNPALDGSAQADVLLAVDQISDTIPTQIETGGSAAFNLDAPGAWYVHLAAVDGSGNGLTRHYGPWHIGTFDAAGVPFGDREQSIQIDGLLDTAHDEWLGATEFLDDAEPVGGNSERQSFHATWDGEAFYLGWQGAWWAIDGAMWAYLDTAPGGSWQMAQTPQGVTGLPFAADYAVMVTSPTDGVLWTFDGTAWQTQTLEFAHGPSGGTEVRIPLDTGSLSSVSLLAFAVDDDGWVWSVFPTTNPSPPSTDVVAGADLRTSATADWSDVYQWGALPGEDDPGEDQAHTISVDMALASPQASGFAWGPGDVVTYTVDLDNLEADESASDLHLQFSASPGLSYQSLAGATCADCASDDDWQLDVATLAAGASHRITVTAQLAPAATLQTLPGVTTTVTLMWDTETLAQDWLSHEVDGRPPTVGISVLPGQVLAPGAQTVYGTADDGAGVGIAGVQCREAGGAWQAATGTAYWSMTTTVPFASTWRMEAQAYDRHGQASDTVSTTFTVDIISPTATMDLPATLSGDYAMIGGVTHDPYPTYGRVAQAQVQIDGEGTAWRQAQVGAPGPSGEQNWRYTWDLPVEDGVTHTLRVRTIDAAGNLGSATDWQTVLVDTVAPVVTATQVLTEVEWMDYPTGTPTLSGTVSDGGGVHAVTVRVYLPNGESSEQTADGDGRTWRIEPDLTTGGEYRLYVLAEDMAGNVSVSGPFYLNVRARTVYLPLVVSGYDPACSDGYESDDDALSSSTISTDGTPQQHTFHPAGDVDWVSFMVPDYSVDYVIETFDLSGSTDTVIYLYDSDRQRLLDWNDDRAAGTRASYLYFNPYHTGRFYVKIVHYDPNAGGCDAGYALRVTAQP